MSQIKKAFIAILALTIVVFILTLSTDGGDSDSRAHAVLVYGSGGVLVKQYVTDSTPITGTSHVTFKVNGKRIRVYGNFIVEEL